LASYYQNVLRARAGLVSESYAWAHLDSGFARGRASAAGTPLRELGGVRGGDGKPGEGTMRIYWSGAAFWLQADIALRRERGFGIERVLSDYARCCLPAAEGVDADAFIARLDRLSGSQVFSTLAREYANAPQFPDLDLSYRELGLSMHAGEPRLSDDPAARHAHIDALQHRADVVGKVDVLDFNEIFHQAGARAPSVADFKPSGRTPRARQRSRGATRCDNRAFRII